MLTLEKVSHRYLQNSDNDSYAIQDITMDVYEGEFLGIIGHTGSGKSTIMQHLNGLMKPQEGNVYYCGKNIMDKDFVIKNLRFEVGMVFQYPEYQLFETSVLQDVMFGPRNKMGENADEEYISGLAVRALKDVRLPEKCWNKSPFTLSGGQKRKAAIAGILAMEPKVLVLDEPTAGLDPEGRKQILDLLKWLQTQKGITIVMVSHSMEDVAQYATRIIALENGHICLEGRPGEVFSQREQLRQMGLEIPRISEISVVMKEKGWPIPEECIRLEEVKACV